MRKNKIRILHVAQAAGGVDRYIRMLLKYLDKEKFENILVCSQDFHEEDYRGLADSFEQVEMTRAIGGNDLKAIREVRALIKKYNPNIVYAHSSKAGAIARVADIGLRNHCVYNPHGWAFNMRCSAKKKAIWRITIMAVTKNIEIDGKEVTFKASAAVPRLYRIKFGRDIYKDLRQLEKSVGENDEDNSNLDLFSLEMFEDLAWLMARHADPANVPDSPEEFLDQFNTFSIYQILPQLIELWGLNVQTEVESRKNLEKVSGK